MRPRGAGACSRSGGGACPPADRHLSLDHQLLSVERHIGQREEQRLETFKSIRSVVVDLILLLVPLDVDCTSTRAAGESQKRNSAGPAESEGSIQSMPGEHHPMHAPHHVRGSNAPCESLMVRLAWSQQARGGEISFLRQIRSALPTWPRATARWPVRFPAACATHASSWRVKGRGAGRRSGRRPAQCCGRNVKSQQRSDQSGATSGWSTVNQPAAPGSPARHTNRSERVD